MPDNIKYFNKKPFYSPARLFAALLAAAVIAGICGFIFRDLKGRFLPDSDKMVQLPTPLRNFPLMMGNWQGSDVEIPENILQAAGNDDFVNRSYVNRPENLQSNLYIAYSGRPSTMLGHRPDICYVGSGWIKDYSEKSSFATAAGISIPCIIHRFHIPPPNFEQIFVINFYILNGTPTNDESVFSGLGWRTPNIEGNPARYVAQVQITSNAENSALKAAKDMTDEILKYLPNSNINHEKHEVHEDSAN